MRTLPRLIFLEQKWNGAETSVLLLIFALNLSGKCGAANFTTTNAEPGTQDWNTAIWQPGPVVPSAGNTYEVLNGGLVRNPTSSSMATFSGDALILDFGAALRAKPPSPGVTTILDFPGVGGNAGLILNGGVLNPGSADTTFVIIGSILVAADSAFLGPFTNGSGRNFIITASISGSKSLGVQQFLDNTGVTVLSSSNNYTGNWIVSLGRLTGTGVDSLGTGSITVASGSTFEVSYDIQSPGALILQGSNALMTLHQNCRFSAAIINGVALSAGTYSYGQLASQFPGNFAAGGSGSIQIVPPATVVKISASGTAVSITFSTAVGHTYTVQSKGSLDPVTPWTPVSSQISGDGTIKSVLMTAGGAQVFYRVMVQ